jgi:hypothetical protein
MMIGRDSAREWMICILDCGTPANLRLGFAAEGLRLGFALGFAA